MSPLKREIRIRQAMVQEDRQLLALYANTLRERTVQSLASPKVLLGGFGTGLLLAMLRGRQRDRAAEATSSSAASAASPLLQMLLRDVAMPLALGALQAKLAGEQQQPDQQ
jgi:hypothetical protein